MSICANPGNLKDITSEKVDFLNKEEKINSQVSDPIKDNFGSEEANTSSSSISINFNNYKNNSSSSGSEEDDYSDLEDFDGDDMWDQDYAFTPQCGSKSKTFKKHAISRKKNHPRFQIVDGEKINIKLSNKVDNRLEVKQKRKPKIQEKITYNFDVDEKSNNLLSTMLQNKVLENITGVTGKCKEYTIFHAYIGPNFSSKPNLPKECTIKVFIPIYPLDEERRRFGDTTPKGIVEKKMAQKVAEDKAKKEFDNLRKFTTIHVPCPKPIARNKNILFLSFIGENGTVAQSLGDLDLTDNECAVVYNKVVKVMRILFQEFRLIHTDLSPYNILWHDNECYFTDFNQSIHSNDVHFSKILLRNCNRVESYFSKKGVQVTSYEIFKFVTNCDYWDRVSLCNM